MDSEKQDKSKLLVFVVGTSGSGKDSVMRETVTYLTENGVSAQILKRMITRTPDKYEESNFLPIDEFLHRKNEFALSWNIYDNWYGIPWDSINAAYENASLLLINVSRGVLYEARRLFPSCLIILVTVPKEIAESRIKNRGREDHKEMSKRLRRMSKDVDMPAPSKIVNNVGVLQDAAKKLSEFLIREYKK
jgi:phosphonate metabolism protein PhnN/1,5-bisphosphokinase (PRPP-forming)